MNQTRRTRNRRDFQPEALEDRNLLSLFRPNAQAVEHGALPRPSRLVSHVNATLAGTRASDPLFGALPAGYVGFSGHGTARPSGGVLVGVRYLPVATGVTGQRTATDGTILLTDKMTGSQLRLAFTGSSNATIQGGQKWAWTGTVAGGTGRFIGATGTFQGTGTVPRHGQFQLGLTINFNPPA